MSDMTNEAALPVEQSDRDAAAEWLRIDEDSVYVGLLDELARLFARHRIAALSQPAQPSDTVIDVDRVFWDSLVEAAGQSKWIPREHYFANDWVSDCRDFLINGPQPGAGEAMLRKALVKCEAKFRHYEDLHRLKCTADGDEKADRNREMADMCRAALAAGQGAQSHD